jgi:hypothetical protein
MGSHHEKINGAAMLQNKASLRAVVLCPYLVLPKNNFFSKALHLVSFSYIFLKPYNLVKKSKIFLKSVYFCLILFTKLHKPVSWDTTMKKHLLLKGVEKGTIIEKNFKNNLMVQRCCQKSCI